MVEAVPADVDLAEGAQPRRAPPPLQGVRKNPRKIEQISQGESVFNYAKLMLGEEAISHTVQSGGKIRLPRT